MTLVESYMKNIICVSLLSLASLNAHVSVLNLENLDNNDYLNIQHILKNTSSDFIVIKNSEISENDFENFHKFSFPEISSYTFYSKIKMDHLKIYDVNSDNFILEGYSDELPEVIYYGHLPSLSFEDIKGLRALIFSSSPYINKTLAGDLLSNDPFKNPLFDLCKGDVELKCSGDSHGNRSASAEVNVRSDDNKEKGSVNIEVRENDRGEKEARVEVSYKVEF